MLLTYCTTLALAQQEQMPVTAFCYSQEPSPEIAKLIATTPTKLVLDADKLRLRVAKIGDNTYIYPANLWNLDEFQRKLDGVSALTRLGSSGKGTVNVADLDVKDREGIWELIKRGAIGKELAPVWKDPGLVLVLKRQDRVKLNLEGTEHSVVVEKLGAKPSTAVAIPSPPKSSKTIPEVVAKKDRGHLLSFRYLTINTMEANLRAVRNFTDYLEEVLRKQNEDYKQARVKLLAAFPGDGLLSGSTLAGSPKLLDSLMDGFMATSKSKGFKSADEARLYLNQAKLGDVESDVFIGFYKASGGGLTGGFQSTKVSRFGGP